MPMATDSPLRFDTKIVIVVRDDLATWQKLNMTACLASAVTAAHPEAVGEPYHDADGTPYLAMLGQPTVVFTADREDRAGDPFFGYSAGEDRWYRNRHAGVCGCVERRQLFVFGDPR